MLQATAISHDIQVVSALRPAAEQDEMILAGGRKITLRRDHPDHDLLLLQADGSLRRRVPVGVVVDAEGYLLDLGYAHLVKVRSVHEGEEAGDRVKVAFWDYSAICYLTREHPEFDRIHATLTEAAATGTPIWFANRSWPEEQEFEVWNQILDVRSGGVPDSQQGRNGTAAMPKKRSTHG